MKAGDAVLLELARRANVRPTVIFHAFHYRKQMGDRYSPEGYASFTGLPITHVASVMKVIDELPVTKRAPRCVGKSQLPEDWVMPEEWLALGRERRFWTMDVCRTEADRFANWHRMKGNAFADWKAAWRNWIDGSHREDGKPNQAVGSFDSDEARRAYLAKLG